MLVVWRSLSRTDSNMNPCPGKVLQFTVFIKSVLDFSRFYTLQHFVAVCLIL